MRDNTPNSWEARADKYSLYGFTDLPSVHDRGAVVVTHGKGPYIYDTHGRQYLDANSGLWNMVAGFDHPGLIETAQRQYEKLAGYHAFFGRMSDQTVMLSQKLVEVSPFEKGRVFYTNSGSEANDTMVKILWFLHAAEGKPQRRKILTRVNSYHGVTAVSASMTGKPYNSVFGLPLPGFIHLGCPHYWRFGKDGESEAQFTARLAAELEATIIKEGPDTIAGFFAEPVMGAGGVIPPSAGYFQAVAPILRKYGIPLISDEVICGFGRTGNTWGCETYDFKPDAIISSKNLTAGFFPMGAVILGDELARPGSGRRRGDRGIPARLYRLGASGRLCDCPEGHRRGDERRSGRKRPHPDPEIRRGSQAACRKPQYRGMARQRADGGAGGGQGQGHQDPVRRLAFGVGTHRQCLHRPRADLPPAGSGDRALPAVHHDRRADGRDVQQA